MTTVLPTFASVTSARTRGFTTRARRHDLPTLDGSATETSEPFVVEIVDVGPFGSGPTGGAVAPAGTAETRAALTAARIAMRLVSRGQIVDPSEQRGQTPFGSQTPGDSGV
jgi:hypothetical protein